MISIIVPIFNVSKWLQICINSILSQTYRNYEIINVDDGSYDECASIVDEYALLDNRILIIHSVNKGLSFARNLGLEVTSGDYITFIDSDDYVSNDYLSYLYNLLTTYSADVSICNFVSFKDGTRPDKLNISEINKIDIISGRNACLAINKFNNNFAVSVWNKLYRKKLLNNIRFQVGRFFEDLAFTPIVLYKANLVVLSNKITYFYNVRIDSISHSVFSIKNFDEIRSIDDCIEFYKIINDFEMLEYATFMKNVFNSKNNILAFKYHINDYVPVKYKMNYIKAWNILYSCNIDYLFEDFIYYNFTILFKPYILLKKINSLFKTFVENLLNLF